MNLPIMQYPRQNNKESNAMSPRTMQFKGYNANPVVEEGELRNMSNCSSRNFPCISPRSARTQYTTITAPNAIYSTNSKLCWVDGTSFYYDGVSKGSVTSGNKSIIDFNGKILIFPDKKYYDYNTSTFGTLGTGTYPASGSVPDMDYICSYNNRVFGVKDSNIYASKLADCTNWTAFAGLTTDSYATDVGTDGVFTGVAVYSGHVVFFKKDVIHELYGDLPSNYKVLEVTKKGCIDGRTISEVNGILYFLSRDGVNTYGGGVPRLISQSLNASFTSGVAGSDGRKYYASLYDGSAYALYIYDTLWGVWHKEDALNVKGFTFFDGIVYALISDTTSKITKFNYGTETVSWYAETEIFDESILMKKYYSKIMIKVELSSGSTLDIYIKTDNGAYTLSKSYTTANLQVITHSFPPKKCNNLQIKLVGLGDAKIYNMQRDFVMSSDV